MKVKKAGQMLDFETVKWFLWNKLAVMVIWVTTVYIFPPEYISASGPCNVC